jgi:hypothetical protein
VKLKKYNIDIIYRHMSSLKSYFRKKHKYETQSDLANMTAEQIVSLSPGDVGYYIETETGEIPLEGVKRRALMRLLAIKRENKRTPSERARQGAIQAFLTREGLGKDTPEVKAIFNETASKIVSDRNKELTERIENKDFDNRLRALNDLEPIPDTESEKIHRRQMALEKGGRKTVSKRKRKAKKTKKTKNYRRTTKRRKRN